MIWVWTRPRNLVERTVATCCKLKENFSLEVLANESINPTYRTVQNCHNEWRLENLSPRSGPVKFNEDPFALVIITPLMQRAQSLKSSSDIVFVDSTSTCNADNYSITFMLTPYAAGKVPLAIIITKECGINCFDGVGWPKIFIIDNATAEIKANENNWPKSIHLLCISMFVMLFGVGSGIQRIAYRKISDQCL
ncbi:hypothetical protein QTP88_025640 [Uroleucon formosanum]